MTDMGWAEYILDSNMDVESGEPLNAATLDNIAASVKKWTKARYVLCHVHDMILHCDVFPHSDKAFRMTRKLNMVVA